MLYRLWHAVAAIILLAHLIAIIWEVGRNIYEDWAFWRQSKRQKRSRKL